MSHTPTGDKFGRIHMERQDFSKLQNRKMKGLKKRAQEQDPSDQKDEIKRQKFTRGT